MNRFFLNASLFFFAAATCASAFGQSSSWINSSGGDFSDAANWSDGVPAGTGVFDVAGDYEVALTQDATMGDFEQSNGTTTLSGMHELLVDDVDVGGTLKLVDGAEMESAYDLGNRIAVGNGASLLVESGSSIINVSSMTASGRVSIDGPGSLLRSHLSAGSMSLSDFSVTNGGRITADWFFGSGTISGAGSQMYANFLGVDDMVVEDGATVNGGQNVGIYSDSKLQVGQNSVFIAGNTNFRSGGEVTLAENAIFSIRSFAQLAGQGSFMGEGTVRFDDSTLSTSEVFFSEPDVEFVNGSPIVRLLLDGGSEFGEYGALDVGGDLRLGQSVTLNLNKSSDWQFADFDPMGQFILAKVGGARTGEFRNFSNGDLFGVDENGNDIFFSYQLGDGNDIGLSLVSTVPEPGSAVFVLLGFVGLSCRRRVR